MLGSAGKKRKGLESIEGVAIRAPEDGRNSERDSLKVYL